MFRRHLLPIAGVLVCILAVAVYAQQSESAKLRRHMKEMAELAAKLKASGKLEEAEEVTEELNALRRRLESLHDEEDREEEHARHDDDDDEHHHRAELEEDLERLERIAADLKAAIEKSIDDGNEEAAEELEEKLHGIHRKMEQIERQFDHDDEEEHHAHEDWEQEREHLEAVAVDLKAAIKRAAREGRREEAGDLERKLVGVMRELEEIHRHQHEHAHEHDEEHGHEHADGFDARIKHLHTAADNLRAAGFHEEAHHIQQRIEQLHHEREQRAHHEHAHGDEVHERIAQLHERLEKMGQHVERLTRHVEELTEVVKRLQKDD